MTDFQLRPMEPADGPAIDVLLRREAQTTAVAMTTHYRHDVYRALIAQHPGLLGVVAEAPGLDGLVGMATVFLGEVAVGGRVHPSAHLENLKVRHDVRRRGLGAQLAAWRIEEAYRRLGADGVVTAGIEASNAASLATARRWSTQMLGPVRLVIGRTAPRPSRHVEQARLEVRPLQDGDVDAVVDGLAAFYADHDMVPPPTAAGLTASLAPTPLGESIREYRVAVAPDGAIVGGAGITERFKLMVDHIDRMPLPIAILGRISGLVPADRMIRSVELHLVWHAPGRVDAARRLWDAIRHEWHGRATNVVGLADPRSSLIEAFHVGRSFAPRLELMAPVRSPVRLDEDRLLYMWR